MTKRDFNYWIEVLFRRRNAFLETAAIVAATVDIARELGIRVVAEAVELPEQRDALIGLGVTQAQGHLFYPPLSAVDIPTLVHSTAA